MVAEVLEQQGVEAEKSAHRLAAQGPLGARLDRVPPLLGHPLGTSRDVAVGAVGGGQHQPRDAVRCHEPDSHARQRVSPT
jgi:hypothetical protein